MIEDMGEYGPGSVPPVPPVPPPGEARPSTARSKARGVAAGVGVALVVGAGGIAVASSGGTTSGAAGATPTATEGAPTPGPGGPGHAGGRGGFGGFGGIGGGIGGDVLHGTYVVAKSGGGYQTIQTQNGTVSSVSSTSLSVKSKDGYSFTYVVKSGTVVDAQSAGIGSVKKGDTVTVSATVSGKTGTIDRVMDVTLLQKSLPDFKGGYGYGGAPGGAPGGKFRGPRTAPNATATPGATT